MDRHQQTLFKRFTVVKEERVFLSGGRRIVFSKDISKLEDAFGGD